MSRLPARAHKLCARQDGRGSVGSARAARAWALLRRNGVRQRVSQEESISQAKPGQARRTPAALCQAPAQPLRRPLRYASSVTAIQHCSPAHLGHSAGGLQVKGASPQAGQQTKVSCTGLGRAVGASSWLDCAGSDSPWIGPGTINLHLTCVSVSGIGWL